MAHGDHLKYQAKPKAGRQTLFRLTSYLVCDRLLLSVIGVLIVLSIAANLGGSYLLRPIINRYIIPGDFLGLGKMLGILIGVYLTGVFAVYVEYRLLNKIDCGPDARRFVSEDGTAAGGVFRYPPAW